MTSDRRGLPAALALLSILLVAGCKSGDTTGSSTEATSETRTETTETTDPAPKAPVPSVEKSSFDAPGRIVAVGDVHGDFAALQRALKAAELIDESGGWVGEDATLVQTGDLLDRGDDEREIVDYLHALRDEAAAAGGRIVLLSGNHEVMNVAGDLRYVTPGGFADFEGVEGLDMTSPVLQRLPENARARMAAFMPGGPYAERFSEHLVVAIVDDVVFAHGGVLPHHVEYGIDAINEQTSEWMLGERDVPMILQGEHAPIWTREYSSDPADCQKLTETLDALNAERLVVGHTPQTSGITSACDGRVWRIDVGMSAHYGGEAAALRIDEGEVTAVK